MYCSYIASYTVYCIGHYWYTTDYASRIVYHVMYVATYISGAEKGG